MAEPEQCKWCTRGGRKCWLHGGVGKVGVTAGLVHLDRDCSDFLSGDTVVDPLGTASHVTCGRCRHGGGGTDG